MDYLEKDINKMLDDIPKTNNKPMDYFQPVKSQTNTNPDLPKKKLTTTTSKPVQNVPVKAEHTVIEERVKQKEQILKQTLESRKLKMIEEEKRLQMVQKQLKDLEGPMRTDVSIIRNQIEQCDKELSAEGKELEILEKAYFEKQKSYARKMLQKSLLQEQLNSILCEYEKRKEEKLNELDRLLNHSDDA